MSLDFDYNAYIRDTQNYESLRKLAELENKLKYEKNTIMSNIDILNKNIEQLRITINDLNGDMVNGFGNNNSKDLLEKYLNELNHEKIKINEVNSKLNEIKTAKDNIKVSGDANLAFNTDGNFLTITDKSGDFNKPNMSDEPVLVHCTDFFPQEKKILSNYDGRKTGVVDVTYNGVTKKCKTLIHRHSVHVTLNNVVRSTPDGAGEWNQPKFIVIDSLDNSKNNFVNLNPSDSWTYGSIELGEKPIILVREDVFNEIPEKEFENYNIIKYRGDYDKCVKNIIKSLGFNIKHTDPGFAGHNYSTEMCVEEVLNKRNISLNFVLDNSYNGIDSININSEQMVELYGVFSNGEFGIRKRDLFEEYGIYNAVSSLSGVPISFVKFIIDCGIENNNGNYTFKNDDDIYMFTKKIEEEMNKSKDYNYIASKYIDISNIKQLYKSYVTNSKSNISEREKILFEYGQEFGDLSGAATGSIFTKEQDDMLNDYQSLLDRDLDSLSDIELQTVINVCNLKLDLISKNMKDNGQIFKINLLGTGKNGIQDIKRFNLTLETDDIVQKLSNLSGIDIESLYEKLNDPSISDEEADKIDFQITHLPNCHLLSYYGKTINTDLDLSKCKTVREMSDMLMRYAKAYEKFYSGEKIEFDQYGHISKDDVKLDNTDARERYEKAKAIFEANKKIVSKMAFSEELQNNDGRVR